MSHQKRPVWSQMHGMGIKIRNWIENWRNNRKQRIVVNGVKSEWLPVTSGVTQSSVQGALSVIYINDIDANVSSSALMFADDTKLHRNVCTGDQMDRLQCDLAEMSE